MVVVGSMVRSAESNGIPAAPSAACSWLRSCGAEDLADQGDTWQLTSDAHDLNQLRAALEAAGIPFDSADLTMLPTSTVPLESEGDARKVLRLVDALEDHDDVQNVYANFDIPDSVLQSVEA